MNQSYLNNPPLDAVVDRAGGDPRNVRRFNPKWSKLTVSDTLLGLAMPPLTAQIAAVAEKYQSVTTKKARKEGRLDTAKGSVESFCRSESSIS